MIIDHGLIINPALPVHGVAEPVTYARQHPGELSYGTYGIGSTAHLNMELLARLAGIKLVPIRHKGAAPAQADVIGGHIQLMYVSAASGVQAAAAGPVRLLAIGGGNRLAAIPDVPTVAEAGFPGYRALSWFGLFAPAGTPRPIVDKVNGEVRRLFADPRPATVRADRQHARGPVRIPRRRIAEMEQADPRHGHQGRMRTTALTNEGAPFPIRARPEP